MNTTLLRLYAREMDEKWPPFCRKDVNRAEHSTQACSTIRCGCIRSCNTVRCGCSTMRSTFMMIDMTHVGPDIQRNSGQSEGANSGIIESVNCGRITRRGYRQGAVKGPVRPEAPYS
jgi:hypothetical protein